MVSAGEARQQLSALRQQVEQARPQVQQQQRQIQQQERLIEQQGKLVEQRRQQLESSQRRLKLSPSQLRKLTRIGLIKEEQLRGTFGEQRKALDTQKKSLEGTSKRIQEAREKLTSFSSRLDELAKIAKKGITSSVTVRKTEEFIETAREQGLVPVIKQDELVGFRDEVLGQSISVEKGELIVETPFTKVPTVPRFVPGIKAVEEGRIGLRITERPEVKEIPELARLIERPRPTAPSIGITEIREFIPETREEIPAPLLRRIETRLEKLPGGTTLLRNFKRGVITLKDIERRFPTIETFKPKPIPVPEGFVREDIITAPIRKETIVIEPRIRRKTFFEKLGVKEDKDSVKLRDNVEKIQAEFVDAKITELEAQAKLDDELNKFTTKKAIKGLPKTVAIGLGLTALQGIPILGTVATTAIAGDALLRRREITRSFKKFPKASAINTAGFLVGGLAGRRLAGATKGKLSDIDPESLKSVSLISGKERTKIINQIQQVNPDFAVAFKNKKVTGMLAYKIATKDGRSYKVLQFNKLKQVDIKEGLRGETNFLGLQTDVARGELITGRGIDIITNGKSESFIRLIRFQPGRGFFQTLGKDFGFNRAKAIDILERSQVIKQKGKLTQVISEARISQIKSISRNLENKIGILENKLRAGQKVTPIDVKSLINLERRANGLQAFTEKEFREAGTPVITTSSVESLLRKVKVSLTKNENLARASLEKKAEVTGLAFAKPGEFFKVGVEKAKIERTPLEVTFKGKEISLADFSKQIRDLHKRSLTATKSQLTKISRTVKTLERRLVGQKAGSLTLALAEKLKEPRARVIPGAVPGVTTPSAFFGIPGSLQNILAEQETIITRIPPTGQLDLTQRTIINNLQNFKTRTNLAQDRIQKLKLELSRKLKFKVNERSLNLTRQSIRNAEAQATALKQLQRFALRLKTKQDQILRKAIKLGVKEPPISPSKFLIISPGDIIGLKKKPKVKPTVSIKRFGYFAFAKQRGKFVKISKVPVTKKTALNQSAFFVDKTLSATGFIKKTDKIAKKPKIKVPRGYFGKTQEKYRTFRISKGKKIDLKNMFIEKRKFRLDAKRERQTIQQLRKRLIAKTKNKNIKKSNPMKSKPFKPDNSMLSKRLRRLK